MTDWVEALVSINNAEFVTRAGLTALVIAILYVLRRLLVRLVLGRVDEPRLVYRWSKTSTYVTAVIGFLVVGGIWIKGFQSLVTYLGLLSAGLAIALQGPVVDMVGRLFILTQRPFDVGDRIEVAGRTGDVVDQRLFQFTLLEVGNWVNAEQSTGRLVHVPNRLVFSEPLANSSRGFPYIWIEIPVLVTFESDWRACKLMLSEIADECSRDVASDARVRLREASREFMILYANLTPVVYTSVQDSGVVLTVRLLCDPRQRRGLEERIWEEILTVLVSRDDIDLAYPTMRVYQNQIEGKPGARAERPVSRGDGWS